MTRAIKPWEEVARADLFSRRNSFRSGASSFDTQLAPPSFFSNRLLDLSRLLVYAWPSVTGFRSAGDSRFPCQSGKVTSTDCLRRAKRNFVEPLGFYEHPPLQAYA
jgi:hypothetical protein